MATIALVSASKFIGCPIMYKVTPASISSAATFHHVRLVAILSGSSSGTFEFSEPVSGSAGVDIDISSAFIALADKHEYAADSLTYPAWSASLTAYDDYLLNGEEKHIGPSSPETPVGTKYIGKLTDRERLLYGTDAQELPSHWTRKPTTSPEICFKGNPHLTPAAFSSAPSVAKNTVAAGMQTFGGYKIYGISKPDDGFELRFINSLGVHENVFITCLRQSEVNIKNDFYTTARRETLTKFSRGISVKQNDYETWKMSSGPVDFRWQQWWLHEPLMAKWAWLNVDSQWMPVHIVPEETTVGIDRAKGNLLEVQFTLRFDINGSPFK